MECIEWSDGSVVIAASPQSAERGTYQICRDYQAVCEVLRSGTIHDPSSLAVAAAMGIALGAERSLAETIEEFDAEFQAVGCTIMAARPGDERLVDVVRQLRSTYNKYRSRGILVVRIALVVEALIIQAEELAAGRNDPCMFEIESRPGYGHADIRPANSRRHDSV